MDKKIILIILDGWGFAEDSSASAINKAETPFIDCLMKEYPSSYLKASGLAVGLPDGQMGNSEVGHMNIGAGRVVYQDLVKINQAVQDGSIADNEVLREAMQYADTHTKRIHLVGLVSDGGVHSHFNHLEGLLAAIHQHSSSKAFVHAFTDGRDTDPKSGIHFIEVLEKCTQKTTGILATIIGRYYAMDRDNRWERVSVAYKAMVEGVGEKTNDPVEAVRKSYENGVTDEFIKPIICSDAKIEPDDVVLCFNFRTDRGREITQALTQRDFAEQGMKKMKLHYVTMTNYDESFEDVHIMYDKEKLKNTLGEVLARASKKQIRIAETEKYPHVTFFFSGGKEAPFEGEERILCPSPKVATYDLAPQMSAQNITDNIVEALEKQNSDFVCLNFANPDMVGHTGVFEAVVEACEIVDGCSKQVVESALKNGYLPIIIADHGNAELMVNENGSPNTAHTTNLVPFIVLDKQLEVTDGRLCDLAPTILHLMGVPAPDEMNGEVLVS